MEIKNNVEIVQESFSAFDCEHRNKRWVSVESIIKELKCPEVNDMETMDEAYEFLAKRMNKIIDALTSNSKGSPSENSFNKGYEVNQK
jgi:Ca2+-binding EF-hand superfamily protein